MHGARNKHQAAAPVTNTATNNTSNLARAKPSSPEPPSRGSVAYSLLRSHSCTGAVCARPPTGSSRQMRDGRSHTVIGCTRGHDADTCSRARLAAGNEARQPVSCMYMEMRIAARASRDDDVCAVTRWCGLCPISVANNNRARRAARVYVDEYTVYMVACGGGYPIERVHMER